MKVKRDTSIVPLAPTPTSTAEQYENAEAERRAKFLRDRKMKAAYTIRSLMSDLGLYEFAKLIAETHVATSDFRDREEDALVREQLLRLHRAFHSTDAAHPAGKPIFLSFRVTPNELRAIAKWHNEDSTRKATYGEISEFLRVVYEANLKEILDTFQDVLPVKIKKRRARP